MTTQLKLRDYQAAAIAECRTKFRQGLRRLMLVSPTGSGKTVIGSEIIRLTVERMVAEAAAAATRNQRVLFIAHRQELISQTLAKLLSIGLDVGVTMANHPRWRPSAPVQLASRDTLVRRINNPDFDIGDFALVVIDEAHHAAARTYLKLLARWPKARVLGLSATPWRDDNLPLGGALFEDVVVAATPAQLIQKGALVQYEGFVYATPSAPKKTGKDYSEDQQVSMVQDTVLGGEVIRDYMTYARGQRALVFSVNIEHSKAMVQQAVEQGIPAVHVDADTPDHIREHVFGKKDSPDPRMRAGALATGEVLLVSNVGIATEGTDIPAIQVIILARPTDSLVLALQMMGRGLRPWCHDCLDAPKDGCRSMGHNVKTSCRIHDHACVMYFGDGSPHHGLPDDERDYSLGGEPAFITCKLCGSPVLKGVATCSAWNEMTQAPCGWKVPVRNGGPTPTLTCSKCKAINKLTNKTCCVCGAELPPSASIKVVEDAAATRMDIAELRNRRPGGGANLTDHQILKAANATKEQKIGEYLRLQKVAQDRGFKKGFAFHQYLETFGVRPKWTDVDLAEGVAATKPFFPWRPPNRT